MQKKKKLLRSSTVPESLNGFCKGQLKMLKDYFEVVAVSSPLPELEEMGVREGIRTIPLLMERHISIFKDLVSLFKMIGVMRRERPYIVHSMTPKAGLLCMISAWICRVPIRMHTYTGLVFPTETGLKQKVLILMDKLLCKCATYINPEGKGVASDLKKYHITKKELHIIGCGNVRGVDLEYWNPLAIGDLRDNKLYTFLFVGRLVGDKGINELVLAFKRLLESVHEPKTLRLLLVGPYEKKLDPLKAETIGEINNNPQIQVVGKQQDVRPYYMQADAFVFPSYREGFPNTVLEAGAMGLPQIVTDINGANEIIVEGENGEIIPPKDTDALFNAMKGFLENPEKVLKYKRNAREAVASRFEQKKLWNELLKEYQSF